MIKKLAIIFFSLASTNLQTQDFLILKNQHGNGLFSVFMEALGGLHAYEQHQLKGLSVDFATFGLYYDRRRGPNWWTYYFEPLHVGEVIEANSFTELSPISGTHVEFCYSKEENQNLIAKYIRIKPDILKEVSHFAQIHFREKFVVGVHYRGTDKTVDPVTCEAPRVSYDKVAEAVTEQISRLEGTPYIIFVATDEEAFLQYMLGCFANRICFNEKAARSKDGYPPHHLPERNRYESGKNALIDCLLLSKSDILIRTSSNLSLCSFYFNPGLKEIELSRRNPEYWQGDCIPIQEF